MTINNIIAPITPTSSTFATTIKSAPNTTIQVAVRVRPRISSNNNDNTTSAATTRYHHIHTLGKIITLNEKSYAFDHVFGPTSTQEQVFRGVASGLVDRFIEGYNAVLLINGAPGAGKSFSLGMGPLDSTAFELEGIIPRAVAAIFDCLSQTRPIQPRPATTFSNFRSPSTSRLVRPTSLIGLPRRGSTPNINSKAPRNTVRVSYAVFNSDGGMVDLLANRRNSNGSAHGSDETGAMGIQQVLVRNMGDVLQYLEIPKTETKNNDIAVFSITLRQEKWVRHSLPKKVRPALSRSTPINKRRTTLGGGGSVKAMIGEMEKQARQLEEPAMASADEEEQGDWVVTAQTFHFCEFAHDKSLVLPPALVELLLKTSPGNKYRINLLTCIRGDATSPLPTAALNVALQAKYATVDTSNFRLIVPDDYESLNLQLVEQQVERNPDRQLVLDLLAQLQEKHNAQSDRLHLTQLEKTAEHQLSQIAHLEDELRRKADALDAAQVQNRQLYKHLWDQEKGTQTTLRVRLEELERAKRQLDAVSTVAIAQDQMLVCLNSKLDSMSAMIETIQDELRARESEIDLLENEKQTKETMLAEANATIAGLRRDIEHTHHEKYQITKMVDLVHSGLRRQDARGDTTATALLEMEQVLARQTRLLAERDRQIAELEDMLRKAKDEMERYKDETDIEIQRTKALECQIIKLDDELAAARKQQQQQQQPEEAQRIIQGLESQLAMLQRTEEKRRTLELSNSDMDGMVDRIAQLTTENQQLAATINDLEGQLVLQRNKLSLEQKNLELQIMRLSSQNARLEKELENNSLSTSSPTTTIATTNRSSIQSQHGTQRNSTMTMASSGGGGGSNNSHFSPPTSPRVLSPVRDSILSGRTRLDSNEMVRATTTTATLMLPPPSAPPSNPLPPIPTSLPAVPSTSTISSSSSTPSSSPLQRENSTTTVSTLDNTVDLTSERYERMIRTLQRKMKTCENDVRAHQDVIARLELQLSRSEHALRESKRQIETLTREKLETAKSAERFEHDLADLQRRTQAETRSLADQLEEERKLKLKAEKARHILENRMEELLTSKRKSKFMCF
ncbi:hypothetical protein BX666DRAFT_1577572 [Dichotomocladium elegans]|nr:hypothetical protein BX666DRAFT_1577572 [Dichotomocladium elegans]